MDPPGLCLERDKQFRQGKRLHCRLTDCVMTVQFSVFRHSAQTTLCDIKSLWDTRSGHSHIQHELVQGFMIQQKQCNVQQLIYRPRQEFKVP